MKKRNFYFICECVVILTLLAVIAFLIKDDDYRVIGKEGASQEVVQEVVPQVSEKDKTVNVVESVKNTNAVEKREEKKESAGEKREEKKEAAEESTNKIVSVQDKIALENQVQIVVFGDSIWNAERGENGISEQVMEATGVKIYNCAIGGTTAAVVNESTQWDEWTSRSFNGMMYIANDIIGASELIPNDEAYEVIREVDFENVDYVIVSYGLNDYFSDVPIYPQEYFDLTSFVGALRHGVHKLKEEYPHLKFILTSPTYCGWFEGERQFGLDDYVEAARGVSQEYDTYFLDMYHALGDNPEEKSQYLEDGVHLTDEGLTVYANCVIDFLNSLPKEELKKN